jgi:hypothetical protein
MLKEGDLEVDEINVDSDIEVGEEKDSFHSVDGNKIISYKKKNMDSLNDNQAMKVPKSLSVNNADHCKGPNIFLLRDKICGECKGTMQECLYAVNTLAETDVDKNNKVNFHSVLKDLAKNLHKIKHQTVLNKVIELLQFKGDDTLLKYLMKYLSESFRPFSLQDAFISFEDLNLMTREYSQYTLRVCIVTLKQKAILSPILRERRPYIDMSQSNRGLIKSQTRSVNRVYQMTKLNSKTLSEDHNNSSILDS